MLIDLIRFFLCGGGGQFREEKSAAAGEATATEVQRNNGRPGALLLNCCHLCIQFTFSSRTIGVQDGLFVNRVDFKLWQEVVMQKINTIEQCKLFPQIFIFRIKIIHAGAKGMSAGCCVYDDGIFPPFTPSPEITYSLM